MKRRMIGVMTAAAMGLSLAGCGANAAPAIETSTAAQEAAPTTEKAAEPEEAETAAETEKENEAAEESAPDAGGTLVVGFDQDFPPMGFLGDDGEYTGFDLELAQEVAKRLGLTYQPQPIAWDA